MRRTLACLAVTIGLAGLPARADAPWVGDFETNDLSQWTNWQIPPGTSDRLSVVPAHLNKSRFALRVRLEDGDVAHGNRGSGAAVRGGWRAELVRFPQETEGDEAEYSWSTMFDSLYPSAAETARRCSGSGIGSPSSTIWQVITQWHQCDHCQGASPPVSFVVDQDRVVLEVYGPRGGSPARRWILSDLDRGRWHDFRMQVRWSTDASLGYLKVWHNDVLMVDEPALQTLFETAPGAPPGTQAAAYLKLGLYRCAEYVGRPFILFHDEMRRDPL